MSIRLKAYSTDSMFIPGTEQNPVEIAALVEKSRVQSETTTRRFAPGQRVKAREYGEKYDIPAVVIEDYVTREYGVVVRARLHDGRKVKWSASRFQAVKGAKHERA